MGEVRKILVAIDDSEGAQRALQWTLDNFYRDGDIIALLHVIPRPQATSSYGAPPVDMLPSPPSTEHQEELTYAAQQFIKEKFLPRLQGCSDDPEVHIARVGTQAFTSHPQTFSCMTMRDAWLITRSARLNGARPCNLAP